MRMAALALPLLLALLIPGAAEHLRAAAPPTVTVLAAGDLRGEIKPCGCSPQGQMGGLPRRLSYLEQAEKTAEPAPILVDLGNNDPEPTEQGRAKIDLIRTLLERFPPQAVLPGPAELALGNSRLDPRLPYVVSNDALGRAFVPVRRVTRAGRHIGIYGYLTPAAVYQGHEDFRLRPADGTLLADLRARVAAAGDDAALLLFRGDDAELAAFGKAGIFDGIVAGNPSANELVQVTERKVAGQVVPQVPTKGQGVLRLALPLGTRAAAAALPMATVDWLTDRWPDYPAAAPVFAAYDAKVKSLFFARLELQQKQERTSPYAGVAACTACHATQQTAWNASRHSHALATLQKVGKQYDPECLACHVVGLERGGYLSQDLTPQLANVQCENCHGPAKAHAANPAQKPGPVPAAGGAQLAKPGEQTCRTCHRGSHSPKFDFAVYWPKIAHGAARAAKR